MLNFLSRAVRRMVLKIVLSNKLRKRYAAEAHKHAMERFAAYCHAQIGCETAKHVKDTEKQLLMMKKLQENAAYSNERALQARNAADEAHYEFVMCQLELAKFTD